MSIATATKTVALIAAIGTPIGGGYAFLDAKLSELDARKVEVSDYQDFQWSYMKGQIRQIRKEMREWEESTGAVPLELEMDLRDMLDLLCRKYPEDRECR